LIVNVDTQITDNLAQFRGIKTKQGEIISRTFESKNEAIAYLRSLIEIKDARVRTLILETSPNKELRQMVLVKNGVIHTILMAALEYIRP
jgi:hypothetical protein